MNLFVQAAGWIGTILIVLAYFLVSNQFVTGNSAEYQIMNLAGAASMGIHVYHHKAWPALALQIIWAIIAIKTLIIPN